LPESRCGTSLICFVLYHFPNANTAMKYHNTVDTCLMADILCHLDVQIGFIKQLSLIFISFNSTLVITELICPPVQRLIISMS